VDNYVGGRKKFFGVFGVYLLMAVISRAGK